ncbi:hypothetical protein RSAG8_13736, partial [Rhizoctonia solani AG-8 WAC10335]
EVSFSKYMRVISDYCSKNTSGDTKIKAHGRIASVVIPAMHTINPKEAAKKVQTEYTRLVKKYGELYRELMATGSGIGGDDSLSGDELEGSGNKLREVEHACYIPPSGPDAATTTSARNKWQSISERFPLFEKLHSMFCTRPTQVPIATTTGIGPQGPRTVLHQAPSRSSSPEWDISITPAENHSASTKAANVDSSDFEIIEPTRNSSPPIIGNGKGTDPRERRPRLPSKKPSEDVKVKVEGKKKEEKQTPPNPSTKIAAAVQSSSDSSGGSTGNRKRKSRDEGSILQTIHEGMQERHARIDARQERERADASYNREMDRLFDLRRIWPEMPMEEFRAREDGIRREHGKPPLVRPPLPAPGNTIPQPAPQLAPQPASQLRPLATSTSGNMPRTPSHTRACPVMNVHFPFGTPIKPEPIDTGDDDGLFHIPKFPLDGANANEALFANPLFGFAGPST